MIFSGLRLSCRVDIPPHLRRRLMALLKELKKQLRSVMGGPQHPSRSQHRTGTVAPHYLTPPPRPPSKHRPQTEPMRDSLGKQEPPEEQGYEHLQREVYTDGFESIYALENVDISTVRPLGQGDRSPSEQAGTVDGPSQGKGQGAPEGNLAETQSQPQDQLEMDFGERWRDWMPSLKLSEPIHVLGLTAPAHKALMEGGKTRIGDIVNTDSQELIALKGLGQGHLDEIFSKCATHLGKGHHKQAQDIDFAALLRSLLGTEEHKACSLCLEPYGLAGLFPLGPADEVELRHLSAERRHERRQTALLELGTERRRHLLDEMLRSIVVVFVQPWMRQRLGVATEWEIMDRIERVSVDASLTRKVMAFLRASYCDGHFPLRKHLPEGTEGVYCVDQQVQKQYTEVLERSYSYLPKSSTRYRLEDLSSLLERECAGVWRGFPEGFVSKVFQLTPEFSVRKAKNQRLYVQRCLWPSKEFS